MRSRIVLFTTILVAVAASGFPGPAAGQEHDHEHGEEGHGHAHGGFPEPVDLFFTHHAYLERKIHPRFDAVVAETGNQYVESLEAVWRFNHWLGAEVEAAAIQTDPEVGDGVSGFGDIEIAPMVAFVQDPDRLLIVSARSGFVVPTGDEEEGLGVDGWGWEPGLLVWKGFGAGRQGALQAELGYDRSFLNEGQDEEELVYNLGLSWWTRSSFIPVVELNGVTRLSDQEEHEEIDVSRAARSLRSDRGLALAHGGGIEAEEDTLISGTIGFRYAFANEQQWGAAIQLPLSGTDAYDWRFVVGGIIHLQ